jgi:hypothetical protein
MDKLRHPFRSIREPFGTAGLIVAMLALIAALGGSALAANAALSGRQKKEVEKIAKKVGEPGPQGPVGPKGDAGSAGTNGNPGAGGTAGGDGRSVEVLAGAPGCPAGGVSVQVAGEVSTAKEICNGQDGETGFAETLPPGKSETGVWAGTVHEVGVAPISFAEPLAAPISEADTKIIPEGGVPPSDCENPGHAGAASVENPEAKPGLLCIYVDSTADTYVEEAFAPGGLNNGAGTTGSFVLLQPEPTSTFGEFGKARGTWAVTAP